MFWRVDNLFQWLNPYPVDKTGMFLNFFDWTMSNYQLDKVINSSYNQALTSISVVASTAASTASISKA